MFYLSLLVFKKIIVRKLFWEICCQRFKICLYTLINKLIVVLNGKDMVDYSLGKLLRIIFLAKQNFQKKSCLYNVIIFSQKMLKM